MIKLALRGEKLFTKYYDHGEDYDLEAKY